MKFITSAAAILSVALIAGDCSAQPPGKGRGQGKPGAGQRQQGQGQGQRGQRPPQGDRDPAMIVSRMMKEFDKDGDQKLNMTELTALFTSMRERRENGGGRPGAGPGDGQRRGEKGERGQGKDGQKPQGRRDGQGRGEKAGDAGGDKPRRPPVE